MQHTRRRPNWRRAHRSPSRMPLYSRSCFRRTVLLSKFSTNSCVDGSSVASLWWTPPCSSADGRLPHLRDDRIRMRIMPGEWRKRVAYSLNRIEVRSVKLATLSDGTRDGRLVIVAADQSRAVEATAARTLLAALENWASCEPLLRGQAGQLEANSQVGSFPFRQNAVRAPLPRAP